MTGSREEAEDLAQETFVAALTLARVDRSEEEMRAWLFGIAHNKVRHRLRRKNLENLLRLTAKNEPEFTSAMAIGDLILQLPAKQREAFLLVKVEGFTSQEAAKVLRAPEGTIKHRVFSAVKKLQENILSIDPMPEEAHHAP